jgi:hypothetical protein
MCSGEFDYIGWEQWGSWRRRVLGYEALGRCEHKARDRAFVRKRHDCSVDCDSPSQCIHRRFDLVALALMKQAALVYDDEPLSPVASGVRNDELPPNKAVALTETEGGDDYEEPTSPKSLLGQSSFLWDEPELEKKWKGEEENIWWVLGDIPENEGQGSATAADEQYSQDRPVSRLTVRNLNELDVVEDSDPDSDCDSDGSDWSSASSGSGDDGS